MGFLSELGFRYGKTEFRCAVFGGQRRHSSYRVACSKSWFAATFLTSSKGHQERKMDDIKWTWPKFRGSSAVSWRGGLLSESFKCSFMFKAQAPPGKGVAHELYSLRVRCSWTLHVKVLKHLRHPIWHRSREVLDFFQRGMFCLKRYVCEKRKQVLSASMKKSQRAM